MVEKCTNRVCPYCEGVVSGWPERPECCAEVHSRECGDEGRPCPPCQEKEEKYWRGYFGLRPGMSKAERRNQLDAMNPTPATDEQMDEWRKLK